MGLFTPDMAFEDVVKDQIRKLMHPAMKCIDMVATELGEVVQKCGEGVSHSLIFIVHVVYLYVLYEHSCTCVCFAVIVTFNFNYEKDTLYICIYLT